ncbi:MAG: MarR family winged helix-turn-helix transcriptional regulator [Nannocystaceae bacterium]
MSDEGRELRDAFRRSVLAQQILQEARRPCGAQLPLPHAYALLELLQHGTPMSVGALAKKLSIDRTNVSRLCLRMEAAGELQRSDDPHDGRGRLLRLTAHGTKLARHVDESSSAHFGRIARRLGGESRAIAQAFLSFQAAVLDQRDEDLCGEERSATDLCGEARRDEGRRDDNHNDGNPQ